MAWGCSMQSVGWQEAWSAITSWDVTIIGVILKKSYTGSGLGFLWCHSFNLLCIQEPSVFHRIEAPVARITLPSWSRLHLPAFIFSWTTSQSQRKCPVMLQNLHHALSDAPVPNVAYSVGFSFDPTGSSGPLIKTLSNSLNSTSSTARVSILAVTWSMLFGVVM